MYSTVCGTAVEYDNAGNLIKDHRGYSYVYDYENRIVQIYRDLNSNDIYDAGTDTYIAAYTYDALGRRIEKVIVEPGTGYRCYYDDQRVILENYFTPSFKYDSRTYVFGNYIDDVLMMCPLGLEFYYAHDHLYSPAVLFNSSGGIDERYEYEAYGKRSMYSGTWAPRTSSPMGNFYAFTGRELDYLDGGSLQIMYYRARYYDPESGRFMQRDPLGINPAGRKENQFMVQFQYTDGMNLYKYVSGNPLQYMDNYGTIKARSGSQHTHVRSHKPKTLHGYIRNSISGPWYKYANATMRYIVNFGIGCNGKMEPFVTHPYISKSDFVQDVDVIGMKLGKGIIVGISHEASINQLSRAKSTVEANCKIQRYLVLVDYKVVGGIKYIKLGRWDVFYRFDHVGSKHHHIEVKCCCR